MDLLGFVLMPKRPRISEQECLCFSELTVHRGLPQKLTSLVYHP